MNALPEEPPALDLGSVSTLLGATSASVIKASTSCTLEANTNVTVTNLRHHLFCFFLGYWGGDWEVGGREAAGHALNRNPCDRFW